MLRSALVPFLIAGIVALQLSCTRKQEPPTLRTLADARGASK